MNGFPRLSVTDNRNSYKELKKNLNPGFWARHLLVRLLIPISGCESGDQRNKKSHAHGWSPVVYYFGCRNALGFRTAHVLDTFKRLHLKMWGGWDQPTEEIWRYFVSDTHFKDDAFQAHILLLSNRAETNRAKLMKISSSHIIRHGISCVVCKEEIHSCTYTHLMFYSTLCGCSLSAVHMLFTWYDPSCGFNNCSKYLGK